MADKRAKRRAEAEQHMLMMPGGEVDQDGGGFTDDEGNFINLDAEDEEVMVDEAGGADHHDQDIGDAATHAAIDNEVEENIFTVRQPGASDDDNEATQTARPENEEEPPAAAESGNDKKALVDAKLNQDRQTAEKPILKDQQQTEGNIEDKKQEDDDSKPGKQDQSASELKQPVR